MQHQSSYRVGRGFTVIELLVVLAAIALLLSIAAPRYVAHLDAARETALRQDLRAMRDAIDKFHGDQGRYPAALEELATRRYLRAVPEDPVTQRTDTWVLVPPPHASSGAVYDVRSGAPGQARDGSAYASW
ncbi:type II secretion system protein [Ideonella sp. BN130291]|uniref:type II secretion system protein n=1 Tax=Ideonella sp. BN130291 TaxID=3112940 RepID=UPI002E27642E|nr:prepilin-type N-terminal cleavage/methylation domain-containing protein [Ideonella sp. BN130291]